MMPLPPRCCTRSCLEGMRLIKPRLLKRYHDSLVRDEVFLGEVQLALLADLGAAFVAVFGFEIRWRPALHDFKDASWVGQQVFQVSDGLDDLGVFF